MIHSLFQDLCKTYTQVIFQYVFMALTWLILYETWPIMTTQLVYRKKHLAPKIKELYKLIQGLFNQTISFESYHEGKVYIIIVDTVNLSLMSFGIFLVKLKTYIMP